MGEMSLSFHVSSLRVSRPVRYRLRPLMKTPGTTPLLRLATVADLPAVNDIYNHYVLHSNATYQEIPETPAGRLAWFEKHGPQHPVTVVTIDHVVVGWASLSPFHPRSAYRFTVEDSVYLHPAHTARGLGTLLLADLISRSRALGHRSILALIDAGQPASIRLHDKFHFRPCADLRQVGWKNEQWLDVVFMQLVL